VRKIIILLLLIFLANSCCLAQKVIKLQGKGEGYWRIKPGVSVGEIKIGMTYNQIKNILGAPDTQEGKAGKQETCIWNKYGLQINLIGSKATLIIVRSGTIEGKECKTREGITINSQLDLVISKFGSDFVKESKKITDAYSALADSTKLPDCLIYKDKGIFFKNNSQMVTIIGIFRPGEEPEIKI
jgi:hypothetical protein